MQRNIGVRSFLDYLQYEKRYSNHTITAYNTDLCQFIHYINEEFETNNIDSATSDHIRSWIVHLMESGVAPKTINRKVISIRTYYTWRALQGLTMNNPAEEIIPLKTDKKLPEYVEESAMKKLLDEVLPCSDISSIRNRLIIELLYQTGIRLSELINITTDNISVDNCEIKVTGKRNKQRVIPIGRNLAILLREYLDKFKKDFGDLPYKFLFLTDKGKPLYPKFVYRLINESLKRVTTMSKRSPHVIRHTFATTMLDHGADINAVKELLGHSSLASTQVYTHVSAERLKKIYRQAHPRA